MGELVLNDDRIENASGIGVDWLQVGVEGHRSLHAFTDCDFLTNIGTKIIENHKVLSVCMHTILQGLKAVWYGDHPAKSRQTQDAHAIASPCQ